MEQWKTEVVGKYAHDKVLYTGLITPENSGYRFKLETFKDGEPFTSEWLKTLKEAKERFLIVVIQPEKDRVRWSKVEEG